VDARGALRRRGRQCVVAAGDFFLGGFLGLIYYMSSFIVAVLSLFLAWSTVRCCVFDDVALRVSWT
jgi:hypothetical protein